MVLAGLGPGETNTSTVVASQELNWFSWAYGYGTMSYFPAYGVDKYGLNPAAGDIDGDTFTMGGKAMRLEKVVCPEDPEESMAEDGETAPETKKDARVISLADLKKK